MPDKNILILCVNYNSEFDTIGFFRDVEKQSISNQIQFVAVCNGSKSMLLEGIEEACSPRFSVYYCKENNGYFNAAHEAYMYIRDGKKSYKHVVVSNADVKLGDQYFFENYLRLNGSGCIVAPSITTLDGRRQNPFLRKRPSKIKLLFLKWIFRFWVAFGIYSYLSALRQLSVSGRIDGDYRNAFIYAPHGSFIIFKEKYFSMGGTLEHDSFLYGEELHVGEQVRKLEERIEYLPELSVLHKEHAVTSSLGLKKKSSLLYLATIKILKRYY